MTDSDLNFMAHRFQRAGDWLGFARMVESRARAEALSDLQAVRNNRALPDRAEAHKALIRGAMPA